MKQIRPNQKLGFGKYAQHTGAELARSIEGSKYLYWAYQQPGIDVAPELVGLPKCGHKKLQEHILHRSI